MATTAGCARKAATESAFLAVSSGGGGRSRTRSHHAGAALDHERAGYRLVKPVAAPPGHHSWCHLSQRSISLVVITAPSCQAHQVGSDRLQRQRAYQKRHGGSDHNSATAVDTPPTMPNNTGRSYAPELMHHQYAISPTPTATTTFNTTTFMVPPMSCPQSLVGSRVNLSRL